MLDQFLNEAFIRDLLPAIDNLERALASEGSTSPDQLRQGVRMNPMTASTA